MHTIRQAVTREDYLYPRDLNDCNPDYTMADVVFTACFPNTLNRNCDIVGRGKLCSNREYRWLHLHP